AGDWLLPSLPRIAVAFLPGLAFGQHPALPASFFRDARFLRPTAPFRRPIDSSTTVSPVPASAVHDSRRQVSVRTARAFPGKPLAASFPGYVAVPFRVS